MMLNPGHGSGLRLHFFIHLMGSLAFSGLGCLLADNDATIGASPWNFHVCNLLLNSKDGV